jgi:hypothetical protein
MFHALLLEAADGATWLAAGFQQFVSRYIRHPKDYIPSTFPYGPLSPSNKRLSQSQGALPNSGQNEPPHLPRRCQGKPHGAQSEHKLRKRTEIF